MRLLSMKNKPNVSISSIEMLFEGDDTLQGTLKSESNGVDDSSAALSQAPQSEASSSSQMAGIQEMIAQMAVSSSSEGTSDDPKRALMGAIARSALMKSKNRSEGGNPNILTRDPIFNINGQTGQQGSNGMILHQILGIVQRQEEEISQLKAAIQRLEGVCSGTLKLLQRNLQNG